MTMRTAIAERVPAGGPQFPADQPHSAAAADAVHGLVQQDRAAAGARSVDRASGGCSPISTSARRRNASSRACTTASSASSRTARGRSMPIRRCWSAPATPSSAPAARSPAPSCSRSRAFPTRCDDLLRDPAAGRALPRRPLRHAAADLQHVPPLPRAARLPRRAGDLHLRRHLERQSDRAQARREAVLQERARGDADAARRPATCVTLVPVAAILVASIRLHFLDVLLHLRYRGPNVIACDAPLPQGRGDGLVRARLDHHRVRAGTLVVGREYRDRQCDPDGRAAVPDAAPTACHEPNSKRIAQGSPRPPR